MLGGPDKKYLLYFKILKTTGLHTCSQLSSIRLNSEEFSRVPGPSWNRVLGIFGWVGWCGVQALGTRFRRVFRGLGSEPLFGHWVLGIKFVWQHCRAQVEELEIRLWRGRFQQPSCGSREQGTGNRTTLSKLKQQHHCILVSSSYTPVPRATCLFMDVCTAGNPGEHHIAIPFHNSLWKVCDVQCTNKSRCLSHCSTLTDQLAARARWISPNGFIILLAHGNNHGTGGCDLLHLGRGPALLLPCCLLWRTRYLCKSNTRRSTHCIFLQWFKKGAAIHVWPFSLCSSAFFGSKYLAFSNFSWNARTASDS